MVCLPARVVCIVKTIHTTQSLDFANNDDHIRLPIVNLEFIVSRVWNPAQDINNIGISLLIMVSADLVGLIVEKTLSTLICSFTCLRFLGWLS